MGLPVTPPKECKDFQMGSSDDDAPSYLPQGWYSIVDDEGRRWYYALNHENEKVCSTLDRPTQPFSEILALAVAAAPKHASPKNGHRRAAEILVARNPRTP